MDFVEVLTLITIGILFIVFLSIVLFILEIFSLDEGCGCIILVGGIGIFIFWVLPQLPSFIVSIRRFWSVITNGVSSFASNFVNFLASLFPLAILILLMIGLGILLYRRISAWRNNLTTIQHDRAYQQLQGKSKIGDDGELSIPLDFNEIIRGRGTQVSSKLFLEEGIYRLYCKVKRGETVSINVLSVNKKSKPVASFDVSANASYPLKIEQKDYYVLVIKTPNDVSTKWEIVISQI